MFSGNGARTWLLGYDHILYLAVTHRGGMQRTAEHSRPSVGDVLPPALPVAFALFPEVR